MSFECDGPAVDIEFHKYFKGWPAGFRYVDDYYLFFETAKDADRALAALAALANAPAQPQDDGDDGEQECGQEEFHPASLRERRPRGKPAPRKCRIMLI